MQLKLLINKISTKDTCFLRIGRFVNFPLCSWPIIVTSFNHTLINNSGICALIYVSMHVVMFCRNCFFKYNV